jgi:hypothetical protein
MRMCIHVHTNTHTHTRACTCIVSSFTPTRTRQGPDYQIFQNIKQCPYSLKFLQLIFSVTALKLGCALITEVFHTDYLLQMLGHGHHGNLLCLPDLFSFYQGWWRTRISGSGVFTDEEDVAVQTKGQEIPQWSMHTLLKVFLWGLPDLGLFPSTAELPGFPEYQVTD